MKKNMFLTQLSTKITAVGLAVAGMSAFASPANAQTGNSMTFTTEKNPGETVSLYIVCPESDISGVWIDLNNDGKRDANEEVKRFFSFEQYEIQSQTITIHGNVSEIYAFNNKMKTFDASNNPGLTDLRCSNNLLESLDLSKNTQLYGLRCYDNKLTQLNVSKCKKLTELFCYSNLLPELDLSNNLLLGTLSCYNNKLTSFAVPPAESSDLARIGCFTNKIKGEVMTRFLANLPNRSGSKTGELFLVDTTTEEGNEALKPEVKAAKDKNWNILDYHNKEKIPYDGVVGSENYRYCRNELRVRASNGHISIYGAQIGEGIKVYDLAGKELYRGRLTGESEVLPLVTGNGTYIVTVGDETVKTQML